MAFLIFRQKADPVCILKPEDLAISLCFHAAIRKVDMMLRFRKGPTNSKIFMFLMIALAGAALPGEASAKMPDSACFGVSQKQLLCKYFFKNIEESAAELGSWLWHHLRGKNTPAECMVEAFEGHPELYESLRVTEGRRYPTADNQLMIYNTPESMLPVMKKTIGSCYGHATMRSFLSRLAYFDPLAKFEALPKSPVGSKKWIEFYYTRIVKMTQGEPQIIPGFANLREFSEHPQLNNWFKRAATELWATRAGKLKNLLYRIDDRDMTKEFSYKLVGDIRERLDRGYNPLIMFDENKNALVHDYKDSLHIVTVTGLYKMKNDRTALIILDDKKPFPNMYDVLILNHDGENGKAYAYFDQWRWKDVTDHSKGAWDTGMGTVNQVRLVTEGDPQAMQMALNTADFCKKNPKACEELGDRTVHPMPWIPLPKAELPYHDFEYLLGPDGNPLPVENFR